MLPSVDESLANFTPRHRVLRWLGVAAAFVLSLVIIVVLLPVTMADGGYWHGIGFLCALPLAAFLVFWLRYISRLARSPQSSALLVTVATTVVMIAVTPWGLVQFGSYDLSPLVDLVWRYQQGQLPVTDFVSTLPAAFVAISKLASSLPMAGWLALLLVGLLSSALFMSVAVLCVARQIGSSSLVVMIVALGMAAPWIATTHPWHSIQAAQVGSAAVAASFVVAQRDAPGWIVPIAGLLLGLTALSKANIGAILVVGCVLAIALGSRNFKRMTVLIGALAIAWVITTSYAGLPLLYPVTTAWHFLSERTPEFLVIPPGTRGPMGLLLFLPWVVVPGVCIAFLLALTARARRLIPVPSLILCGATTAAWLAAIATNWDTHVNDFPLAAMAMGSMLACLSACSHPIRIRATQAAFFLMVLLLAADLSAGAGRLRNSFVGAFYEAGTLTTVSDGFLAGVQLGGTGTLVINAEKAVYRAACPEAVPIIMGPRLEFLYAQWSLGSPKGLPLWWHPGSSYFSFDELRLLNESVLAQPHQLVTLGEDFTRLPGQYVDRVMDVPFLATNGLHVRCIE